MHIQPQLSNNQTPPPDNARFSKEIILPCAGTKNGVSVTFCAVQPRLGNSNTQKPDHIPLDAYRVRQFANSALQAGNSLVRSAASFAFSQVMNSPYIGAVAPGLKETLLGFVVLYNQLPSTQAACSSNQFQCKNNQCIPSYSQCDGDYDCRDRSDEGAELCTQNKCEELERFICKNNECIRAGYQCDGDYDCRDRSDEGAKLCTQNKCEELKRDFLCKNNRCIRARYQCDGDNDCLDRSDEGAKLCTQNKCEELKRDFLCKNNRCISARYRCDGDNHCGDSSDEAAELCSPVTSPVSSPVTNSTDTELEAPTESSAYGWFVVPAVLVGVGIVTYGVCTYQSYKTLRRENQDSSGIQLLRKALRHPMYFRQAHQPVAATISMQAVDIK